MRHQSKLWCRNVRSDDLSDHDLQYPWSCPSSGWPERLGTSCPLTLSLIERTTPDLIGFQEFMICLYIQETGNSAA